LTDHVRVRGIGRAMETVFVEELVGCRDGWRALFRVGIVGRGATLALRASCAVGLVPVAVRGGLDRALVWTLVVFLILGVLETHRRSHSPGRRQIARFL